MTSASEASTPAHGPGRSRLLRDMKADWKRWSAVERGIAALVAALFALVPLYFLVTLGLMP